ncbi:transducin/WD40 repeat-like superfamily protein [Artemisia annua]|uniref:Transducin/WD40 repeat-like superfamily protein n=1 Tax=Artemisia annua TaxID=35608 RepID=A0A2U1KLX7_ARTAN|nr:transducin/WD40 repeat-like superfamily protein [Artemisia annua]
MQIHNYGDNEELIKSVGSLEMDRLPYKSYLYFIIYLVRIFCTSGVELSDFVVTVDKGEIPPSPAKPILTCIQFNPVDDSYFISGSLDAKVRIWSIPDHQVFDWNDMHEMVTAACYTPDGQAALVGSYKGSCCLYNTIENKLQDKSRINLQNKKKSRHKKITGFQFAPGTASEVLITSADSRIRVVDGADLVHKFKGNTYQIFSLYHILFN